MNLRRTGWVAAMPVLVVAASMIPGAACNKVSEAQNSLCCSDFKVGADMSAIDWGADVNFAAFMQATGDLSASVVAVVDDVTNACKAIAVDLGVPETDVTDTEPEAKVVAWCTKAAGKINTEIMAKGTIKIVAQPPMCTVSASAQASCEGKCSVDATCKAQAGDITVRCDPGKISGKCDAQCTGSCEGSANLAVNCEGSCSGKCSGTCSGNCQGKCDGKENTATCTGVCEGTCDASCKGNCSGSCKVSGGANVACQGDCTGGCSVAYKAPKCTAELKPPSAQCNANANCNASCKGSASAKAECRPGSLSITATGTISASALATLQLNLPKLLTVIQARGKLVADNAQALFTISASLNPANFSGKAAVCVVPAAAAIKSALDGMTASVSATSQISGAIKYP